MYSMQCEKVTVAHRELPAGPAALRLPALLLLRR